MSELRELVAQKVEKITLALVGKFRKTSAGQSEKLI